MPPKPAYRLDRFFQALADTTRLRLLNLIGDQELCVCYFVQILGGPQPKISRHLAYLRRAGIVAARRQGKWMHYRITAPTKPAAAQLLDATLASLKQEKRMQADRARLLRACSSPRRHPALKGVPLPAMLSGTLSKAT